MGIKFGFGLGSGGGGGLSVLAQNRLLGRGSASGAGQPEAITLGNSVVLTGTALDAVQDIRTSASPTFVGMTLTGAITVATGTLQVGTFSATGIAFTSTTSGGGVRFTATGGTDESITATPKGTGSFIIDSVTGQLFSNLVYRIGGLSKFFTYWDQANSRFSIESNINGASIRLSASGGYISLLQNVGIGIGNAAPSYALQVIPTGSVTANQTMIVQDGTLVSGITGIFFNAGANQGTNPILTVGGKLRATSYNVNGTDGANFGPGLPTSVTVVNGIITAIS